jgi:hypothetical protein
MANPGLRPWTADEVAKLKSLAQRKSRKEIASQLGRSISATSVKAHKLKLSLKIREPVTKWRADLQHFQSVRLGGVHLQWRPKPLDMRGKPKRIIDLQACYP